MHEEMSNWNTFVFIIGNVQHDSKNDVEFLIMFFLHWKMFYDTLYRIVSNEHEMAISLYYEIANSVSLRCTCEFASDGRK